MRLSFYLAATMSALAADNQHYAARAVNLEGGKASGLSQQTSVAEELMLPQVQLESTASFHHDGVHGQVEHQTGGQRNRN